MLTMALLLSLARGRGILVVCCSGFFMFSVLLRTLSGRARVDMQHRPR